MRAERAWTHRTNVCREDGAWNWYCARLGCRPEEGLPSMQLAFARAWAHTSIGGYVIVPVPE